MDTREFHIKKNIKDLEFNRLLGLVTTYAVIMATFVITVIFSGIGTPLKIVSIGVVVLFTIAKVSELQKQMKIKLKEIETPV